MFGFGKATCVFCDHRVASKEVLRARDWKDVAVCVGCYESWERAGRKCGACGTVVHGPQEVSAFDKPRRTFGHADCGRSEEHTSELQSHSDLVCRLPLEKKKKS